ncbi:MAG: UTP--glucose-1-phosphate uridylyltransferase [Actinomycetaceae bacterium]|nr:UTP--glucose-1-phosphate uridylyltransferase [Actinomycetaceae bacterium]
MSALAQAQNKMRQAGCSDTSVRVFTHYFQQLESGETGLIPESAIEPLADCPRYEDIDVTVAQQRAALDQTVVVKLNGGLATSMGMDHAKSLLTVADGKSFLDIIVEQIRHARRTYGVRLPLLLMNSFRTQADSLAALPADIAVDGLPLDFVQGKEPKLRVDTLEPISWPAAPDLEWCPPGHGDIYTTLYDQGLIKKLLDQGYRYMATSNADNLGAFPDPKIAGWFATSGVPFAPEVCQRTDADRKGGHLAVRKSDGNVILRESAQTPVEDMQYFMDETRHRFFNTNSLWINLEALDALLSERDGVAGLPLIRNKKSVDPADSSTPEVYQLESAMGALVEAFSGATPLLVPRTRFQPVKTTDDLLVIRSDAYELGDDGRLRLVGEQAPVVTLDPQYFKNIADFDARVQMVPSLRKVRTLRVSGDYVFDSRLELSGDVELRA